MRVNAQHLRPFLALTRTTLALVNAPPSGLRSTTSRCGYWPLYDFPPLPSEKLIRAENQKQQREKSKKTLIDTNLVIFGGGTQVSLVEQGQTDTTSRTSAVPVTPHRASNLSPQTAPGPQ